MALTIRKRRADKRASAARADGTRALVVPVDDASGEPGRVYGVATMAEPLTYWTSAPGETYRIVTDDNGTPIGAAAE